MNDAEMERLKENNRLRVMSELEGLERRSDEYVYQCVADETDRNPNLDVEWVTGAASAARDLYTQYILAVFGISLETYRTFRLRDAAPESKREDR